MSMVAPEPDDDGSELRSERDENRNGWSMSELASRIDGVKESEELERRLMSLPHAWVLVFEADTEDEAVYSMEVEDDPGDDHVVLAFERREDAEAYARSLHADAPLESKAEVQALDLEALIVTSREADFRVALVFAGDLEVHEALKLEGLAPIFAPSQAPRGVSVSITMVPDHMFADRKASDYMDPNEDPVWVLVHDAGTGDAQYFSMQLNGTESVVCFKDVAAAERCSKALVAKGSSEPAPRELLLEELLDTIHTEMEVCLVDEVIETYEDEGDQAAAEGPGVVASDLDDTVLGVVGSADRSTSQAFRSTLEGLFSGEGSAQSALDEEVTRDEDDDTRA